MQLLRSLLKTVLAGLATQALAQTSGANNDSSVLDRSPLENVRSANVAARSPGNAIIRPALARHQSLTQDRLNGGSSNEDTGSNGSGNSAGTSGSSSTDTSLTDLLSSISGGSLGGLGGSLDAITGLLGNSGVSSLLSGALGSVFGGATGTDTSGTTGSSASTGASGITPSQQSSLDLLLQLRDQNAAAAGSTAKAIQSSDANSGRGVVASETKANARSQTTNEEEDSFRVRLYDSWLGTTFTALTVAFSSRAFIDSVKDGLRNLFDIPAPPATTQPSSTVQIRHIAPATERMTSAERLA